MAARKLRAVHIRPNHLAKEAIDENNKLQETAEVSHYHILNLLMQYHVIMIV